VGIAAGVEDGPASGVAEGGTIAIVVAEGADAVPGAATGLGAQATSVRRIAA
jgi:hypothetical protein